MVPSTQGIRLSALPDSSRTGREFLLSPGERFCPRSSREPMLRFSSSSFILYYSRAIRQISRGVSHYSFAAVQPRGDHHLVSQRATQRDGTPLDACILDHPNDIATVALPHGRLWHRDLSFARLHLAAGSKCYLRTHIRKDSRI